MRKRQAFRWRSISWGSAASVITRILRFWKIVGEVGNPVIFGSDAHEPDKVWNPAALKKGEEIVKENGLHLLDTTELVNPAGTLL